MSVSADVGATPADADAFRARQLALFECSVLKRAKWSALREAAGPLDGCDALDLGADNGVISWLFRREGGRWTSADLTDETVESIRRMVDERVYRLADERLPFEDASFDRIVVVDLLEHVRDDARLVSEIARCLRPGGRAVLNVPHDVAGRLLPRLRHAIGLTDAWHGHLRPGYDRARLERLLPETLRLASTHAYSGPFSHSLDTALNWAYLRGARGRARSTAKGMVVTGASLGGGSSRALALAYPAMRAFAALDALAPWSAGYMLVATVERIGA